MFALLTGGGTGGHVYPALALADTLVARGHPACDVRFVGARRGIEARVVADAGYDIDLLPGRGLRRGFDVENVRVVWDSARALAVARRLVWRHRPKVVVGFGGYASLPAVAAARLARVPTVVHDQDAAPGLANRIAVRLGARAAVSLPGTPLRGAVLVGNPVRPELVRVIRQPAEPPLIGVFGGSLGARSLNEGALALYGEWRDRTDVSVHHVTGVRNFDECERRLSGARRASDHLSYTLAPYEHDMAGLLSRASVVVCRSGAGTIAELAATGTPAVLVPLPGAPSDHQSRNAQTLVDAGAAVSVRDDACTGHRLAAELDALLATPGRIGGMSAAAHALARPDAVDRLADLVEAVADG